MPKFICPLLWGLVGIKLLLPFDIHSSFGLLPSDKIVEYSGQEQAPVIVKTGLRMVDESTYDRKGVVSGSVVFGIS